MKVPTKMSMACESHRTSTSLVRLHIYVAVMCVWCIGVFYVTCSDAQMCRQSEVVPTVGLKTPQDISEDSLTARPSIGTGLPFYGYSENRQIFVAFADDAHGDTEDLF